MRHQDQQAWRMFRRGFLWTLALLTLAWSFRAQAADAHPRRQALRGGAAPAAAPRNSVPDGDWKVEIRPLALATAAPAEDAPLPEALPPMPQLPMPQSPQPQSPQPQSSQPRPQATPLDTPQASPQGSPNGTSYAIPQPIPQVAPRPGSAAPLGSPAPIDAPLPFDEVRPLPYQPAQHLGSTTTFGADGWTVTIQPRLEREIVVNGMRYEDVYRSIPYRRAEYLANPGYRHEATLEILMGELRPKTVVSHYQPQTIPLPQFSPYKPYRYSQTELNYHTRFRPFLGNWPWGWGAPPAYPGLPLLY